MGVLLGVTEKALPILYNIRKIPATHLRNDAAHELRLVPVGT